MTIHRISTARRWLTALLAVVSPDDERIRRAYALRQAMTTDRPDLTLIRGPLPDFMREGTPARRAG